VSADEGKTACLVSETLADFAGDIKSWINTEIVSVQGYTITNITIAHPDSKASVVLYKKGNDFQMDDIPGKKELDQTKAQAAQQALSYLNFDDIADPALTDEQTGINTAVVFTAVTTKGEIFTAKVGGATKDGANRYVRLTAAMAEQPQPVPEGTNTTATAVADERKQTEAKIIETNQKIGKWTYVIANYKAEALSPSREAMIKEKSKEEAKEKK
jgi:hypothetical protein